MPGEGTDAELLANQLPQQEKVADAGPDKPAPGAPGCQAIRHRVLMTAASRRLAPGHRRYAGHAVESSIRWDGNAGLGSSWTRRAGFRYSSNSSWLGIDPNCAEPYSRNTWVPRVASR